MAADPNDVLRRHLVVRSAYDALVVVKSAGRVLPAGTNLVVFLDDAGRFVTDWPVSDSDDQLEFIIAATCELAPDHATGVFLVSVRTGEVPSDRPDDERRWCTLGEVAEDAGVDLLDWFVVCGTVAFSVDAVKAHPELRYDASRPHSHRSRRSRPNRRSR